MQDYLVSQVGVRGLERFLTWHPTGQMDKLWTRTIIPAGHELFLFPDKVIWAAEDGARDRTQDSWLSVSFQ